jgi:hypothetical protein
MVSQKLIKKQAQEI